jgi:carbonic anhydrase
MIKVFLSLVLLLSMATATEWSYKGKTGPDRWGKLSKEFIKCEKGIEQSPIDIHSSNVKQQKRDFSFSIYYKPTTVRIKNTGHTIEVWTSGKNDNFIKLNGTIFHLTQFHFHSPSEHQIDSKSHPMEIHFVNKSNDGKLAVLTLFVKAGKQNGPLESIFQNLPKEKAQETVVKTKIHLNDLFLKKSIYYQYEGSLTTPPCSEEVQWIIFREPIGISRGQLDSFTSIYFLNNRPIQPANNRDVRIGKRN